MVGSLERIPADPCDPQSLRRLEARDGAGAIPAISGGVWRSELRERLRAMQARGTTTRTTRRSLSFKNGRAARAPLEGLVCPAYHMELCLELFAVGSFLLRPSW